MNEMKPFKPLSEEEAIRLKNAWEIKQAIAAGQHRITALAIKLSVELTSHLWGLGYGDDASAWFLPSDEDDNDPTVDELGNALLIVCDLWTGDSYEECEIEVSLDDFLHPEKIIEKIKAAVPPPEEVIE